MVLTVEPHSFAKKQKEVQLKREVKVRRLNQSFYILIPKAWIRMMGPVKNMLQLEFKPGKCEIVVRPLAHSNPKPTFTQP